MFTYELKAVIIACLRPIESQSKTNLKMERGGRLKVRLLDEELLAKI